MTRRIAGLACISAALTFATPLIADDLDVEGRIDAVNPAERSLVVAGQTYYADERTDYDDDLKRYEDLRVGDRVEIDYAITDGRRIAREIEKDD